LKSYSIKTEEKNKQTTAETQNRQDENVVFWFVLNISNAEVLFSWSFDWIMWAWFTCWRINPQIKALIKTKSLEL